ncbi:MAG: 6-carboxytetrahydropterin synthase [Chloroflexota bacterium]|nr:MAG: 6-carboxytetrahydropterin synthase [Chloroflexota bacterium]
MYEVGVVTQFEAAHRLQGDFGPATRLHGHTYRVEICVRGDGLRHDYTLLDLNRLQTAANQVVGALQYQDLDTLEHFQGLNSTGEVVARHIHRYMARSFRGQGLNTLSVRVWESPAVYVLYEAPLEM